MGEKDWRGLEGKKDYSGKPIKTTNSRQEARDAARSKGRNDNQKNQTSNKSMQARDLARSQGRNKQPKLDPKTDPPTGNNKTGGGNKTPSPASVEDKTVIDPVTGKLEITSRNTEYLAEIRRLVLSLINDAKDLLLRYDFAGIDSLPEYFLDADRQSFSQAVPSKKAFPKPLFNLNEAQKQNNLNEIINQIANIIGDTAPEDIKNACFGAQTNKFFPGKMKIVGGVPRFDLQLEFNQVAGIKNYSIKCYEVS